LLAWADGGTTGITNLGQPCPKHHRLKHSSGWTPSGASKNSPPGWTSPSGRTYPSEQQDWEPPDWPGHLPATDTLPVPGPPADPGLPAEPGPPAEPGWDPDLDLPADPGRDPDLELPPDPFTEWRLITRGYEFPVTDTEVPLWPTPLGDRIGAVSVAEALVAAFLAAHDDARA
ncbi:MAG: hypothetical protein U1D68_17400, partial [Arthrobacter sp.]|nr:hypothetical protein [Arthrobacter sp.]MDZ4351466.1 hypothetical protein [Arthrobacter sp.]